MGVALVVGEEGVVVRAVFAGPPAVAPGLSGVLCMGVPWALSGASVLGKPACLTGEFAVVSAADEESVARARCTAVPPLGAVATMPAESAGPAGVRCSAVLPLCPVGKGGRVRTVPPSGTVGAAGVSGVAPVCRAATGSVLRWAVVVPACDFVREELGREDEPAGTGVTRTPAAGAGDTGFADPIVCCTDGAPARAAVLGAAADACGACVAGVGAGVTGATAPCVCCAPEAPTAPVSLGGSTRNGTAGARCTTGFGPVNGIARVGCSSPDAGMPDLCSAASPSSAAK
ncbi:hypothetical protein GCM10010121_088810 [Streptomyces brasiliensis]|uniref:Uncharacterized protein n=1 Tax=Streptomyces brasiliensis TaxID=1954 RepID=A0A917P6S8_9ACTN|nr:hypothetical protein GCM10010121_088810 [Streptomyces brasiliensis]